ncbi:MAG: FHA domain-containing protein [Myxococcales bacterium]|nr:FHA domain-containing protein [Myxococcales bacterium]
MADQNRKTLHSFYCRDYLWELFEVMTRDLGCSMDYLINESMRHYARSRNYSLAQAGGASRQPEPPPPSNYPTQQPVGRADNPFGGAPPAPPPAANRRPPPPPPEPRAEPRPEPMVASRPTLYLLFNGQRHRIDGEKFVIGRGSQQTELTIRDGNISRQHCAVIFRGGSWYIKDLDSTNGIEFNGKRIEHKRIEEGDTFYLCDYELRFTYR